MPEERIDLGEDAPAETLSVLETKYRDQMRQIVSQKLDLPISTLVEMIDDQINLSPEFQRRDIWPLDKRSRFIESIIMNVPIPPVFLGEDEYGSYVVLDGRQRLTSLYEFLKNGFKLRGLKVWEELNSLSFNDLERRKLAKTLTRRFVPAVVILKESTPEVKYDVFDRLNQGGVIADPMEIRNAIYAGAFNRLLHELSANATFRKLWSIPADPEELLKNNAYSRMYDLELVLRFFALSQYESMNLKFKDYLSDYMDQRNKAYSATPDLKDTDSALFHRAVANCWRVFGEHAFSRPSGQKSAPLADALMNALSDIDPASLSDEKAEKVRAAFLKLSADQGFVKAISYGTNGKGAIETRIRATKAAFSEAMI